MSANGRQVGGQHYEAPIQHWDIVVMHKLDYFQAQIIKYVMRWNKKGGVQDLEKAAHFLQKYIELNQPPVTRPVFPEGDVALNPNKPWTKRNYCTCEINENPFPCPLHPTKQDYFHVGDGSEPGPGYTNQDR